MEVQINNFRTRKWIALSLTLRILTVQCRLKPLAWKNVAARMKNMYYKINNFLAQFTRPLHRPNSEQQDFLADYTYRRRHTTRMQTKNASN